MNVSSSFCASVHSSPDRMPAGLGAPGGRGPGAGHARGQGWVGAACVAPVRAGKLGGGGAPQCWLQLQMHHEIATQRKEEDRAIHKLEKGANQLRRAIQLAMGAVPEARPGTLVV
jgi:hypothetical protein